MVNFKILRRDNNITIFTPKQKDDEYYITYKAINYINSLCNTQMNYNNRFQLTIFKVLNQHNVPSYWGGSIYSSDQESINNLYNYIKIHNGWEYKNLNEIGFYCNKFSDTIIGDNLNILNIYNSYKSPSWVLEQLYRAIDQLIMLELEHGVKNI